MMRSIYLIIQFFIWCYFCNAQLPTIKISQNVKYLDADALSPFYEGYAILRKGASEMMINNKGEIIFPYNKYTFPNFYGDYWKGNTLRLAHPGFNDGKCYVADHNTDKFYLIDENEMEIIPFIEQSRPYFLTNGYIKYDTQGADRYFNLNGKEFFVPQKSYKQSQPIPKSLEKYSFFSADLDSQLLWIYTYAGQKPIYGLADFNGNIIVQPIFEEFQDFSEGLAPVMKRDKFGVEKWGFINTKGKTVIEFKYSNKPSTFHDGLALVVPAGFEAGFQYGYIDKSDNLIFKIERSNYDFSSGKYYLFNQNVFFSNGILYKKYQNSIYPASSLLLKNGKEIDLEQLAKNQIIKYGLNKKFLDEYGNPYTYKAYENPKYENGILYYTLHGNDLDTNGHLGMVILEENISIPPIFDDLRDFDKTSGLTLATAKVKGKEIKGYINKQAEFVFILKEKSKW
jgi:hypothetical protein